MNGDLNKLFDAVAEDYDRQRRLLIPCFDDFYGMALSLAESAELSPRILDLGAGTGLFSHMILQKYPNARLTLIDLSEKMLDGARKRFRSFENVRYIAADYSNFAFNETYDRVLSSLSIHHLTHPMKRIIWLRDAGFADADCMYKYLDFAVFYGRR